MYFHEKRANQVICTGISQIILGGGVFTLSYILSGPEYREGSVFEVGVAYWGGVPTVIAGILGITSGFTGNSKLTSLFLAASIISCVLGGIVSTCVGIALSARRAVGECKHVHCPYDTESILMIALISVSILQAAISISGVIESSLLLCCAVSDRDVQVSTLLSGKSSYAQGIKNLHMEKENRNRRLRERGFYGADYSTKLECLPPVELGFKTNKQSFRTFELSTLV